MFKNFKKVIFSLFVAFTLVLGLAGCDQKGSEKNKAVNADELMNLVIGDLATRDLTKGIEVDGKLNAKFGEKSSDSDFNLKLAFDQEGNIKLSVDAELLPGAPVQLYADSEATLVNLDGFKFKTISIFTEGEEGAYNYAAMPENEESPFAELDAMFDFAKKSETKYSMTAKADFVAMANEMISTSLTDSGLEFLVTELKNLAINFEFNAKKQLKNVDLKVAGSFKIDTQVAEFDLGAKVKLGTALPILPNDADEYLTEQEVALHFFEKEITAKAAIEIKCGDVNQKLAVELTVTFDEQYMPVFTITLTEDTLGVANIITSMLTEGQAEKPLHKIVISTEEDTMYVRFIDEDGTEILAMPIGSNSENPESLTAILAEEDESEERVDLTLVKELLKSLLFNYNLVIENDYLKLSVGFGDDLAATLQLGISQLVDLAIQTFGGMIDDSESEEKIYTYEEVLTMFEAARDYAKENGSPLESYFDSIINVLKTLNALNEFNADTLSVDFGYENNKTSLELALKSATNYISVNVEVNLSWGEIVTMGLLSYTTVA